MKPITLEQVVNSTNGILSCGDLHAEIKGVITDSREKTVQGLFVPIVGEKTDGHLYVAGAVENGATAIFMKTDVPEREGLIAFCKERKVAVVEVPNTLRALQRLAAWYREQFPIPVIGITGSVGKTTTKEMVAMALATKKNVLKTAGNRNSQVGLALTMFELEADTELAVIEMGMSEFGEMAALADIAKPECAVMTNIGVAHIAQLKTQENIRKEKLSIADYFVTNSTLFLNGNDTLLMETATQITQGKLTIDCNERTRTALEEARAVTYGIGGASEFDFCAVNLQTTEQGVRFFLNYSEREKGTGREFRHSLPVELSVPGEHNVRNALAAVAVAVHYGISPERAARGLKDYKPIAMRGQMKEKDGILWIDDTYNASPDSMKSGAQVLVSLNNRKRRIAVLADVLELGERSEELHRSVGAYLAGLKQDGRGIDILVTVGTQAAFLADEAEKAADAANAVNNANRTNMAGHLEVHPFETNAQAVEYLKEILRPGDVVLVKGSRGMKTDEIIGYFLQD